MKKGPMSYVKLPLRLLSVLLVLLLFYAPVYAADEGVSKSPEITGIELLDNTIKVKINGPVKYKIYKLEDPFKIALDLEGISLGRFKDKIFSDKAGITEITPVQVQTPSLISRLNILLQFPSTVSPELEDGLLVLRVKETSKTKEGQPADTVDSKKANADSAASEIVKIAFNRTEEGAEVIIKGDGIIPEPSVFELENKIIIDIPNMLMSAPMPAAFSSPLKDIKYRIEEGKIRFILDLDSGFVTEVFALDEELFIDIYGKVLSKSKDSLSADVSEKSLAEAKDASKLISLDFQDADVIPILRLLSDVSGYNVVIHPEVKGKITMKLLNVPWEQALDIILKTFNLEKVVDGNVIRIATLKVFQEERKAIAETKEVFGKAENIITKVFVVNYANVDKVRETVDKAKLLSPRGNISTDPRTRSMIVKDIPSSLAEIQNLIDTLDKPTTQVLIEARIVEVNSNFSKELGVEWSGFWLPPDSRMTAVGSVPSTIAGTSIALPAIGGGNYFPTLVNLGTTAAPAGAFTMGYLNAAQTFGLDFRISALESSGKGRVVSNPKIMTVDNEKAVIKQGRRIPYSTVSQSGTQVQFVDASLDLIVTPQVGPDKTILLNIQANKNEADFSQTSQGLPSIRTSEATTQVLIKDGETVVIGGILKSTETDNESSVPGISKIPILGALFKRNAKTATSEEQLIFITPRIISQ